jgi:AmiR/NasT family two-component response regulator
MPIARSLQVLIAEADPPALVRLRTQLLNLGHQIIAVASTSRDTLLLSRQHRPDLVVLDISMLVGDGFEASRQLATDAPCPIILLSGPCDAELVRRAFDLPLQAYLLKPVRPQDLERAIGLAVHGFAQSKPAPVLAATSTEIPDARRTLQQAVDYLITLQRCPAQEALQQIQQEARAKKAALHEVASAILSRESVPYHYSVPV